MGVTTQKDSNKKASDLCGDSPVVCAIAPARLSLCYEAETSAHRVGLGLAV